MEFIDGKDAKNFGGTIETINYCLQPLNDRIANDPKAIVTEREMYQALGIDHGRDDWGWGNGQGFHELSLREMHPYACPCCGRPWNEASE